MNRKARAARLGGLVLPVALVTAALAGGGATRHESSLSGQPAAQERDARAAHRQEIGRLTADGGVMVTSNARYQSSPSGRVGFGHGGSLSEDGHWLEQRFEGPGMAPRSRHENQWFGTDSVNTRSYTAEIDGAWTARRSYMWSDSRGGRRPADWHFANAVLPVTAATCVAGSARSWSRRSCFQD